jgi:predicted DNA-binding transcriptional regulator AlpA
MLKIIRSILQKFIDDIDAGNSNLSCEQQCDIIKVLSNINVNGEMSKTQAADYIGVSRATFDNYVHDGFLPKGVKLEGFKELRWYKSDLDIFMINRNSK